MTKGSLLVLAALAAPARADEPPTPPAQPEPEAKPESTPQPEPAPQPEAKPPPDARDDDAWQLYHQAFAALARGDRAAARAQLAALRRLHPGHPATVLASTALEPSAAPGVQLAIQAHPTGEQPTSGAQAELALFQALHGIGVATEVCIAFKCSDATLTVGLAFVGGATGAVIGLKIGDVTPGKRATLNSGTVWGAYNAAMFAFSQGSPDAQSVSLQLLGGQALGVIAGTAIATYHPSAGQVALANSGGEWAFALGMLSYGIANGGNFHDWAIPIALATDAGIGVGAYLASENPQISRGQTFAIDAGGLLGGLAGGAAGVMITSRVDSRATYALAAVGLVAGLATAGYLTRNWGNDDTSLTTTIVPAPGGAIASARLSW